MSDDLKKATEVSQKRIKALQAVRRSKSGKTLGEGVDAKVRDAGDKVVKSPSADMSEWKEGREAKSQFKDRTKRQKVLGKLGADTQYVETSKSPYMVQEKLKPLSDTGGKTQLAARTSKDELFQGIKKKGYMPHDFGNSNVGYDSDNNLKTLDTGEFESNIMDAQFEKQHTGKPYTTRPELPDEYIDNLSISKKNAGKFRRILPMLPWVGTLMGLTAPDISEAADPMGSTSMDSDPAFEDPSSPEYNERITLLQELMVKKKDK